MIILYLILTRFNLSHLLIHIYIYIIPQYFDILMIFTCHYMYKYIVKVLQNLYSIRKNCLLFHKLRKKQEI